MWELNDEAAKIQRYQKINVRMSSDPADISHASKLVLGVDIEDIFHRQRC